MNEGLQAVVGEATIFPPGMTVVQRPEVASQKDAKNNIDFFVTLLCFFLQLDDVFFFEGISQ